MLLECWFTKLFHTSKQKNMNPTLSKPQKLFQFERKPLVWKPLDARSGKIQANVSGCSMKENHSTETHQCLPKPTLPQPTPLSILQLRRIYGLDELGATGKGQTICIYGQNVDGDYVKKCFIGYDAYYDFNNPNALEVVYVNPVAQTFLNTTGEAILDTQMAHGMAPDAKIILVIVDGGASNDEIVSLLPWWIGLQYMIKLETGCDFIQLCNHGRGFVLLQLRCQWYRRYSVL